MLAVGDPAPAFGPSDQDGTTVSLADFECERVLLYFCSEAMTAGGKGVTHTKPTE
jgi:peroxiredoxin